MCADPVLQQGDMDAMGVCDEQNAEEPAVVVVQTPEGERLEEGDSAVVAEPLTAGDERLAEGGSAVVAEPLTAGDERLAEGGSAVVAEPLTAGDAQVSGDSDTEPFAGEAGAGAIDDENQ